MCLPHSEEIASSLFLFFFRASFVKPLEDRLVEFLGLAIIPFLNFFGTCHFRLVALGPCCWTCMAVAGSRDVSWHAGVRDHRWLEVDGRLSNSFQISDGNPLHMRYYIYTSVDHLLFFMWRRIIRLSFWVCWEETVDRKLLCKRQTSCACSFKQGRRLVACCIMLQIPGFETVWQISRKMPVVDWIKRSLAALPVCLIGPSTVVLNSHRGY